MIKNIKIKKIWKNINKNNNKNDIPKEFIEKIKMEKELLNESFPIKNSYHSIIPLKIFQTWHSKDLPLNMKLCVESIKNENPEFEHYLFDDNDCREYIKNNFNLEVLNAFDRLIPGAYKADLWRYCVLYKEGGIYLDIKYKCVNGFKLIALTEKEHFTNDWSKYTIGENKGINEGIYNALLVCLPKNEILKIAINKIVRHVKNGFKGINPLHPTGPYLLKDIVNKEIRKDEELDFYKRGCLCIRYGLYKILEYYPEYRMEQKKFQKTGHYSNLWKKNRIYK